MSIMGNRRLKLGARAALASAVLLVLGFWGTAPAQAKVKSNADPSCSLTSPTGTYDFAYTGMIDGQAYDALMTLSFSEVADAGQLDGALYYAMLGTPASGSPTSVTGSYSVAVATSCEYDVTITSPLSLTFNMVYLPEYHQVKMLETDASGTMTATGWQAAATCSAFPAPNNNFVGGWTGTVDGQMYSALNTSNFGSLTDNSGTYTAELTYNVAGTTTGPAAVTGTYSMTATHSCTGSISADGLTFMFYVIPAIFPPNNDGNGQSVPVVLIGETDGLGLMGNTEFLQFLPVS